ncbi:LysR family transcriptional regulator [Shewanella putrefaciens]|uniref:Transcriptional regulator, LysR family n=2 Tax=Shewanella putrefaciens TaxID=24 RepID=E6XNC0_SHEP2|nr:LysR family transcriptional regulator [Shewanella putrefaciens]MCT8942927.1 LysR family transcriptional regulator [Shewanella putrefaciens]QSE48833.1 LysR family transcriptional regulator [Shewanella putrefaciens]QYX72240.1 LysR family transcriptional regulator [Shewanella putrefaciens]SUI84756.1 D-malate degradation protein R [Shewanella putrefaciens]GGN09745.1 LysR family transcriptional regulator [Shewanella putrefaciens]
MDKIAAIRSFVEVANCGSFTKAAQHLDLSRLQVSRHIQEIEQWLNLRLLHRTTRSVSLTLQGEETLQYCQRLLSEVAAMESRAHSHNTELVGSIRIATPIGLGQHSLFDVVDRFIKLHPKVNIQLAMSDSFAQLVDERVDVALRYTEQPDENLIARRLMMIDAVVCAAPTYLANTSPLNEPIDLLAHNCLVHTAQHSWHFLKEKQSEVIKVTGNLKANDMGVLVSAALRGHGIVRLPCDLANQYLASGQLQEVLPDFTAPGQTLWAVYLSRSYQQMLVRAFIDFTAQQWQLDIKKWTPAHLI